MASGVEGIFAPSETHIHPLATNCFACSPFNSFCVAHGKAISHFTDHGLSPSKYFASEYFSTYSLILPLLLFFKSITNFNFSVSMPASS